MAMTDSASRTLAAAYKITGLQWPEEINGFSLMGPSNNLGAWRWYEKRFDGMTQRIKVNHLLQPIDLKGICHD